MPSRVSRQIFRQSLQILADLFNFEVVSLRSLALAFPQKEQCFIATHYAPPFVCRHAADVPFPPKVFM